MSNDEQIFAMGRMVNDYNEAKRKLPLLESEAERIGKRIEHFGNMLARAPENVRVSDYPELSEISKVQSLADDIRATRQRITDLRRRQQEAGISVPLNWP